MSWYNPFSWGDDDGPDPIAEAQAQGVAAAKDYVSKETTRLEAEFQSKYNAAQTEFNATAAKLTEKESSLNEYSSTLNTFASGLTEKAAFTDDVIQKFNSAGQAASIAAANNGTPQKYSVATQKIEKPGPSPLILAAGAAVAYFILFKKRS